MMIPALIMAGGKGSRMGLPTEKPMLPFLGKPLLDWVAEAVFERQKSSVNSMLSQVLIHPKLRSTVEAWAGMLCVQTLKVTMMI